MFPVLVLWYAFRMMIFLIFAILMSSNQCSGVIYHLNDTEYYRMPPLSVLDIYDECLHQPGGQYCLARFDLIADSKNDLITLIQEYSAYTQKHYNHSYVDRGICVTKSCLKYITHHDLNKNEDLNTIIETCVNASIWDAYGIQAKLSKIYNCDIYNEQIQIDYADWAVAGLISILLLMSFFGSIYDAYFYNKKYETKKEINTANQVLLCFSTLRNWKTLTSVESNNPSMKKLKGLHSIRVIGTFFVIIAHVFILSSTSFSDNPRDIEKAYDVTLYQLIVTGLMIVELFFFMSGLLLVYILQLKTENQRITWTLFPKIMLMRWWRLSIPYAVVLGFVATWLRHLGSGPLWKYSVVNSVVTDCRKRWWLHLLYANNYVGRSICGVHTWHVAADTQLFTIGTAVYLLTRNRGKKTVLFFLLLLGIVAPALHVWLQDFDPIMIMDPEFMRSLISDHFKYLHIPGHNNVPCFIIGMSAGYFIYNAEKFKKYYNLLPDKSSGLIVWGCPIIIGRFFLTGRMFFEEHGKTSLAVKLAYAATHRLFTACVLAFPNVLMMTKLNETSRKFFEWRGWLVPSKLSFGVYLLHMYLIHVIIGLNYQLAHFSLFNMVTTYFAVVTMSFLMAIPLYLIVEAPMGRLINILMIDNTKQLSVKKCI